MKLFKIVAISLGSLLIILAIGGYIFFKKAFQPKPNTLELTEASGAVPITWGRSAHSDYAAILLPVTFEGIPRTFYLQFDTGSPNTLLYKQSMRSIQAQYPDQIAAIDSNATTINQTLQIGEMEIHSDQFELYERGEKPIDWADSTRVKIGTLGADLIEKKITVFDFKEQTCYFEEKVPDCYPAIDFKELKFKLRKVLLPAEVAGRKRNLLHDSGTSGFQLITNEKNWRKLAKHGAEGAESFKVRSWKKELTAYNIASDKKINFATTDVDLTQVTYIKGTSFMQRAGMRATGLGGLIGNELFMGKVLVLDCKNRSYGILD